MLFPAGSGGMVNSNILHMTRAMSRTEKNIQLLHIFDASLIAGEQGSRIEQKYITPFVTASQAELIPLYPDNAEEKKILKLIYERGQEPVTVISHACGLGSSSYFGKVFREYAHCTLSEYRRKWQDCDYDGKLIFCVK